MTTTLITSYTNPDIDGSTSMYVYQGLLRSLNKDVMAGYFGEPLPDAKYAFERIGASFPPRAGSFEFDEVILLDTNNKLLLDPSIKLEKVKEIIDHHEAHLEDFPNAEAQIETVGAVATLVTERFMKNDINPDVVSARLLNLAILHGTILFRAPISTERDKKASDWLSRFGQLTKEDVDGMIDVVTTISKPLTQYFLDDFKQVDVGGVRFGVAAILVKDVKQFLKDRKQQVLASLAEIKKLQQLDYIWFGCVDFSRGITYLLSPDNKTTDILSRALGLKFQENETYVPKIVLRKEHTKAFHEYIKGR